MSSEDIRSRNWNYIAFVFTTCNSRSKMDSILFDHPHYGNTEKLHNATLLYERAAYFTEKCIPERSV